jgi:hypothetical protein
MGIASAATPWRPRLPPVPAWAAAPWTGRRPLPGQVLEGACNPRSRCASAWRVHPAAQENGSEKGLCTTLSDCSIAPEICRIEHPPYTAASPSIRHTFSGVWKACAATRAQPCGHQHDGASQTIAASKGPLYVIMEIDPQRSPPGMQEQPRTHPHPGTQAPSQEQLHLCDRAGSQHGGLDPKPMRQSPQEGKAHLGGGSSRLRLWRQPKCESRSRQCILLFLHSNTNG